MLERALGDAEPGTAVTDIDNGLAAVGVPDIIRGGSEVGGATAGIGAHAANANAQVNSNRATHFGKLFMTAPRLHRIISEIDRTHPYATSCSACHGLRR